MKKIFILLTIVFTTTFVLAQHKTMTVYYSGGTTDVVNLTNTDSIVIFICGASKVNYGGKAYNTVLIGNQCWLKENLNVGTMINSTSAGSQQTNNGILEKYCYGNNPANCEIYGGLYEWPEAMQYSTTPGTLGICPPGWHIPTLAEFETLKAAVNNDGNALKAVGQGSGGGAGTNTSGFSALLAGHRSFTGYFSDLGYDSYFWSSTEYNATNTYLLRLKSNVSNIILEYPYKDYGFSVRCIKD